MLLECSRDETDEGASTLLDLPRRVARTHTGDLGRSSRRKIQYESRVQSRNAQVSVCQQSAAIGSIEVKKSPRAGSRCMLCMSAYACMYPIELYLSERFSIDDLKEDGKREAG